MILLMSFTFSLFIIPIFTSHQDGPIVNTLSGSILGAVQSSRKGIDFYSFRGIRYAEPPVDNLRFKPPVPIKAWNDIFNATIDGPTCYQLYFDNLSEDCLRLNVYTRHINNNEESRPVLVYIHGGSFVLFTGRSDWNGADYLMDHDIVLVTLNYRLGTLGFFSTGDEYAPGNNGMKDQVEALRWVQKNIQAFGGDPNKVTIAGESAGAASVALHLSSPMSRGLFRGAIALSGSSANMWAADRNPLAMAKKQASLLNCPTDTSQNMVDCIKQVPAEDIVQIYTQLTEWHSDPLIIFSPVIESEDYGIERFLLKDPFVSLAEGDIANVPLMIGTTKDELAYDATFVVENEEWAADMSANWSRIAPIAFYYKQNDTISDRLREFYLGSVDQPIMNDSYTGLGRLYSDAIITFGVVRGAKLIAEKNDEPVYLYQFNYQGEFSNINLPGWEGLTGIAHTDDLMYLFRSLLHPDFNETSKDWPFIDVWTTIWKNFVETGNPTPEPTDLLNNVIWTPFKSSNPSYLDINKDIVLVNGLYYENRMSLWEELFPL